LLAGIHSAKKFFCPSLSAWRRRAIRDGADSNFPALETKDLIPNRCHNWRAAEIRAGIVAPARGRANFLLKSRVGIPFQRPEESSPMGTGIPGKIPVGGSP